MRKINSFKDIQYFANHLRSTLPEIPENMVFSIVVDDNTFRCIKKEMESESATVTANCQRIFPGRYNQSVSIFYMGIKFIITTTVGGLMDDLVYGAKDKDSWFENMDKMLGIAKQFSGNEPSDSHRDLRLGYYNSIMSGKPMIDIKHGSFRGALQYRKDIGMHPLTEKKAYLLKDGDNLQFQFSDNGNNWSELRFDTSKFYRYCINGEEWHGDFDIEKLKHEFPIQSAKYKSVVDSKDELEWPKYIVPNVKNYISDHLKTANINKAKLTVFYSIFSENGRGSTLTYVHNYHKYFKFMIDTGDWSRWISFDEIKKQGYIV